MDQFKEKVEAYLEKNTHGALLIDDLWGVGKTYNIKKITTNPKENLVSENKIKYYCYLNIDDFAKNDLKTYVIDNSKLFNTDNYVNLFVEMSTKKFKSNFIDKISGNNIFKYFIKKSCFNKIKLKISEKLKDKFTILINVSSNLITLLCSIFFGIKNPISVIFKGYENWKTISYKEITLDETIVLIIDEIERKSDSLNLKDIFTKLIKLQENNDIKIILIMNSIELNEIDQKILHDWKDKLIHSTLSLNYNYEIDEYEEPEIIEHIKTKIKPFENLKMLINDEIIKTIIKEDINLNNLRILKRIDKLSSEIITIELNLLKKYEQKIKEKDVGSSVTDDLNKSKKELVLIALKYLNNMNLDIERTEYQPLSCTYSCETIEKYFKSDHDILYNRLSFIFEYYTNDMHHLEIFYVGYLNDNISIKNKICPAKLNIDIHIFKGWTGIYNVFSDSKYYPASDLMYFVYEIMNNYDTKLIHFSLLDLLERIYEIRKIELIFELKEFKRISETCDHLEYIIHILDYQKKEYKKFISLLNNLRIDVFVRQLQKKYTNLFFRFYNLVIETYFLKLSVYDNKYVIEYMITKNPNNLDIIKELIDSCLFNNVSFLHGFLKFIEIDSEYIKKEMMVKINVPYYGDIIQDVLNEIEDNKKNNIVEYVDIVGEYLDIKKEKKDRLQMFNFMGRLVKYSIIEDGYNFVDEK